MRQIILVLIFVISSFSAVLADPPVPGNWQLTFQDDFNSFDSSKWNKTLPNGSLTIGKSTSFFLKENSTVANGNLVLTSRKEKLTVTDAKGNTYKTKYTSGYVDSFGKFSQKYGYFEVRMKCPSAKGLHPAFWLMPDRGVQPGQPSKIRLRRSTYTENGEDGYTGKGMEIDIMEYLARWPKNRFHLAAHWDGYGSDLKSTQDDYLLSSVHQSGYNKFGLLWKPGLMVWYANGIEVGRFQNDRVADVPMNIIFSTEMGGDWAGRIKSKALPDETLIDYVKVWQNN